MNRDHSRAQIRLGFILVSITLTIPIFFLFYFMLVVKNAAIEQVHEEMEGVKQVEETLTSLKTTKHETLPEELREIGNSSKLLTDSNLDTHYITTIVIVRLPIIYNLLTRLASTVRDQYEPLVALIRDRSSDLDNLFNQALRADKKPYGANLELQDPGFAQKLKDLKAKMSVFLNDPSLEGAHRMQAEVLDFWHANLEVLKSLHQQRADTLVHGRNQAIEITIGFWLLSILLAMLFAHQILAQHKVMQDKISDQTLRLAVASKMSALGEISAGIAHEINTPLSAIRLNAEMLIENAEQGELNADETIAVGNTVIQVVDQISQIIFSMRKISRDSANDKKAPEKLSAILNDAMILCSSNIKRHGAHLEIDVPPELKLDCRAMEIAQVFINLINNAVDACADQPERIVRIRALQKGGTIEVTVADTGPTISPEVRSKLFTAHFTTKASGQGTGLGLQIVENILRAYEGSISLLNQPQTCFKIEIPSRGEPS